MHEALSRALVEPPAAHPAIDRAAYLERIGYVGESVPTWATLVQIVERHMATIPVDNLDIMAGRGIDLEPAAVDRKMLIQRRGGHAFEHASLLKRALHSIGFDVEQHLARIGGQDTSSGSVPPALHTSLKVSAEGRLWLVDTGFAGVVPNAPLAWRADTPQAIGFGTFRLTETRDGYRLERWHRRCWQPLYEILDFHWQDADFVVASDYAAKHATPSFERALVVAHTRGPVRRMLVGHRLSVVRVDGSEETSNLSCDEVDDLLSATFERPDTRVATDNGSTTNQPAFDIPARTR